MSGTVYTKSWNSIFTDGQCGKYFNPREPFNCWWSLSTLISSDEYCIVGFVSLFLLFLIYTQTCVRKYLCHAVVFVKMISANAKSLIYDVRRKVVVSLWSCDNLVHFSRYSFQARHCWHVVLIRIYCKKRRNKNTKLRSFRTFKNNYIISNAWALCAHRKQPQMCMCKQSTEINVSTLIFQLIHKMQHQSTFNIFKIQSLMQFVCLLFDCWIIMIAPAAVIIVSHLANFPTKRKSKSTTTTKTCHSNNNATYKITNANDKFHKNSTYRWKENDCSSKSVLCLVWSDHCSYCTGWESNLFHL